MTALVVSRVQVLNPLGVSRGLPDGRVRSIAAVAPASVAAVTAPPAPAAGVATLSRLASVSIGALRAVYVNAAGKFAIAEPADPNAAFACGLTTVAASADQNSTAQISGEITHSGWSWSLGTVYAGAGGLPTQSAPTSGALVKIGVATAADKIIIEPEHLADLA